MRDCNKLYYDGSHARALSNTYHRRVPRHFLAIFSSLYYISSPVAIITYGFCMQKYTSRLSGIHSSPLQPRCYEPYSALLGTALYCTLSALKIEKGEIKEAQKTQPERPGPHMSLRAATILERYYNGVNGWFRFKRLFILFSLLPPISSLPLFYLQL